MDWLLNQAVEYDNNECGCGAILSNTLVHCPQCGEYVEYSVEITDLKTNKKTYIK